MMEALTHISKLAQNCSQKNPVIVIGSGASIPFGLPSMKPVADYLVSTVKPQSPDEEDSWLLIKTALANGDHLEQALLAHPLVPSLIHQVVRATWELIAKHDRDVFTDAIHNEFHPPLSRLFDHFLNTSNSTVDVVTTNYDRVIEYACDVAGIHYASAFQPSYITTFDSQDKRTLTYRGKPVQTVKIWKVHGSLDWFVRSDGVTIRSPLFTEIPSALEPLIVTPGVSKYERLTDEPFRSTLQGADKALSNANGYICFGFGFRDRQIEPKMVERLARKGVPIVVATKVLTEEAAYFLRHKARANFLALEESPTGTRARYSENWDGVELPGDYWSIEGFLKLTTG